ncbi:MAG: ketopantoate reductase family protein [Clostridium sp.]|jgi:2-dehydropantoate 2-reductase|uniref:ketopantoate reductase family protein n=1 Tax=Clostridium sp. TaxID=1506 RepID=UPI0025C55C12|nr:ketopantoate reductase family protein [Clostridium sp.]MCH3963647.1 ketopantoate reductase family protein [Clostridium sp.]MCI1714788.1 ketopantoate reductase family protein [Clostridium sp.]MCI1799023.1 ketopantoate reductase family protein [Clostridium sp.]MCI1812971.1 ketopantoate reductase family protein [Clostridium sp.]MCI1869861.1 ketopantoate reductase family protein [Clostridium sp.]
MKTIKRISSIGLGAIGCAYNSKLYDLNPEGLRVIAGGERADRYRRDGFIINGKRYDFMYVDPKDRCEPADLIIVSVKANQLKQAVEDIKNHVGDNTIIISLMNGITSEKIIGSKYGMDKMLYALCIAIDGNRRGSHIEFSSYGSIAFGEENNRYHSEKVKAVEDLFERAGIQYEIPEDMKKSMWYKFMINVGINQTSAVLGATYGLFQNNDNARKFMESAMWEVIRLSQKAGANLNGNDIKKWYEVLDTMPKDSGTSMFQDIKYGRDTEVDMFAGTVCELGEKYNVDTPVNNTLLNIIKVIEKTKVLACKDY